MESIIFGTPALLCGFLLSFVFGLFSLIKNFGLAATLISAGLFASSATYALLTGAGLYKVAVCAVAFFAVNMLPLIARRNK